MRGDGLVVVGGHSPGQPVCPGGCELSGEPVATIRFDIPQLTLLEGTTPSTSSSRDGGIEAPYDHLKHAVHFRAIDRRSRQGVIEPGGVWSVVPAEQPASWQDQLATTPGTGQDERPDRTRP